MIEYYAFGIALVAVVYSVILMQPGMLFGSLYQKLQAWTLANDKKYPDEVYWLKPLVSCALCVSGQWAFWSYLFIFDYHLSHHLYFTALAIFFSAVLRKIYIYTQI